MEKKLNKHFRSDGNGGHIISKQLFSAIIGFFVTVASILPVVTYFEGKKESETKLTCQVQENTDDIESMKEDIKYTKAGVNALCGKFGVVVNEK